MAKDIITDIDEKTGKAIRGSRKKVQASVEYHVKYRREKLREVRVYVPRGSELEAWILKQDNTSGYIKSLIEADMNKGGTE